VGKANRFGFVEDHIEKEVRLMNDIQLATGNGDIVIRWIARLSSLAVNSVFLLILFLAVTNEDKPQGAAIPVLVLLVVTMGSCFAACRWQRAGGIAVLLSSVCLGVAAYFASRAYGVGSYFLIPIVYAAPFLFVGILFLLPVRGQGSFFRRESR
jgi:hypothetical protein